VPRTLAAHCTFALVACVTCTAHAHEVPHATAVGFAGTSSTAPILVLTNRGIITRMDEGWSLRCNEAYGVNTAGPVTLLGYEPSWGLTLATPSSVLSSNDSGCGWTERSPAPGSPISAALATTSGSYLATGLADTSPALHVRSSVGGAWSTLWTSEDDTWIDSLAQAPSAPERLYATFTHPNYETRTLEAAWGSSSDGGSSWTRHPLSSPWQAVGVHPSQPDVVFAQEILADGSFALKRSADGGGSFADVATGRSSFGPLVRGPDGQLWLAGGARGGLLTSDDEGKSFRSGHPEAESVRCLVWHDRSLYVCARVLEQGEGVYRVDDAGAWTQALSFEDVRTATACTGRPICETAWRHWGSEVLGQEAADHPSDAGVPPEATDRSHEADHHPDSGASTAPGTGGARNCAARPAPSRQDPRVLWLSPLLCALAARRRTLRRTTAPPR